MANALENAFLACKRLAPDKTREIRIFGQRRGKQYFMEVANTCDGNVAFDPATAMPISNKDGHGIGSQSIAYFAEKNNAVLQYQLEGYWFHLRLLLKG